MAPPPLTDPPALPTLAAPFAPPGADHATGFPAKKLTKPAVAKAENRRREKKVFMVLNLPKNLASSSQQMPASEARMRVITGWKRGAEKSSNIPLYGFGCNLWP